MKIAVAGGTGLTGRHVVAALRERGHDPVALSRATGADLVRGTGLDVALAGAEAVIDVSNVTTMSRKVSTGFFGAAARNLGTAAERAGVKHLLTLSIVGVDRVRNPYYAGKVLQEEIVRSGAVPWTILRATQFHEFAGQILGSLPGPVAVVPAMRVQPVAVREVAAHLAGLVTEPPRGMAPELAGPREESLAGMCRRLIAAGRARRRPVLPVPFPGAGLLPTGPGPRGVQTFEEWLR
ncbi:SDR family oxidoreductase [Actinoplanes sp. RD1]|uniref:SDR family oxidoreductase n=1 Tax=Actinoplanes sp. RD1 TaxID=3064538 RepID=UPI002740950F|nr:NAD(P)H-binding protein [Actinoplanes sp. RD1]